MKIVVCDDNKNIKLAARFMFPNVLIQTCHNHFLENSERIYMYAPKTNTSHLLMIWSKIYSSKR